MHEGLEAVSQRRVEQDLSAEHVGAGELVRGGDRPVHVRLGGEVHHLIVPGQQRVREVLVADIALDEPEAVACAHGLEVGQVASVGELVKHRDADVTWAVRPEEGAHIMRADEARAPSYKDPACHVEICTLL